MARRRAGAEAEPHAGLDEFERAPRGLALKGFAIVGCCRHAFRPPSAPTRQPGRTDVRGAKGRNRRARARREPLYRLGGAKATPARRDAGLRPSGPPRSRPRRCAGRSSARTQAPPYCPARAGSSTSWCGRPGSRPREDLRHAGIDPSVDDELVGRRGLLEVGEMRALDALLPHPDEARIEGDVEPTRAGAEHHHAAALDDEARGREGRLPGMLEHEVDVLLAGEFPDRLAELARLRHVGQYSGVLTLGNCPQQLKFLRLMTPLAPRLIT